MSRTRIEWATDSWNPVTGCTKVSEGCANCYAERDSKRLAGRAGYPADDPFRVTLHEDRLEQPLRWQRPRRVFVCSMGDLFHPTVPFGYMRKVFQVMYMSPDHIFMVLTKRSHRMLDFYRWVTDSGAMPVLEPDGRLADNIWLGVSVELNEYTYTRVWQLLQIPAWVRFVSCEPLLGNVDLTRYMPHVCPIHGLRHRRGRNCLVGRDHPDYYHTGIDWVIVGGESGYDPRWMNPRWARSLLAQCQDAGVPFFMKQMTRRLGAGVIKEPIPDDLLVREYPKNHLESMF